MSYHDLSSCTLNADERREEADILCDMILDCAKDNLSEMEFQFLEYVSHGNSISVKQLFWLRDIKDKYL